MIEIRFFIKHKGTYITFYNNVFKYTLYVHAKHTQPHCYILVLIDYNLLHA